MSLLCSRSQFVSEHHERQTTNDNKLYVPRSQLAYFDKSFSIKGPTLWNSLPVEPRERTSINKLKRDLKIYFLNQV